MKIFITSSERDYSSLNNLELKINCLLLF